MKRVLFGLAAIAVLAVCSGTVSAQTPVVPYYPQPVVPATPPVVVGGTIITPAVVAPPTVVVGPPVIRVGYPYYGRYYYYPRYHRRFW
jgi:hypothetical protein